MANDERIQKWRARNPSAARLADAEGDWAQDLAPPPLDDAPIPNRREEALAAQNRLREEIADSRLPSDEELAAEMARERKHRRWHLSDLRSRALWFIGVPAALVLVYGLAFSPATYAVRSSFAIMTVGAQQGGGPAAGLLAAAGGGEGLADAYRIREYLLSREAMRAMDQRYGFLKHFRDGTADPFHRPIHLPALGLDEHDFYARQLSIAVDLREGIVRLSVDALTPRDAQRFAEGLIALARERTQGISDQLNADQFRSLQGDVARAQDLMQAAAGRVAAVQRQRAELDPAQNAATTYQMISQLEVKLAEVQAERARKLADGVAGGPLMEPVEAQIASLQRQIAVHRGRLVGGAGGRTVQNAAADLEQAAAQRRLAESGLESTLRTFEQAKLRSIEERRYLVVVAAPVLPERVQASRIMHLLLLTIVAAMLLWGLFSTLRSTRRLRSAG